MKSNTACYYNTTGEKGAALHQSRIEAKNQGQVIFGWFNRHQCPAGPSEVQAAILPMAPITSIRRAMTDLTRAGKLMRTELKRMGKYGKKEHLWALPTVGQGLLF